MKTIIFYKSETGFTKEYVDLLKPRIECEEAFDIKYLRKKKLKEYNNFVFLGPLRNNVILGLDKFLKNYELIKEKNIFIFAIGVEPYSEEKKENIIMANGLELYHVRLYFATGGFDISRFSPVKRKLVQTAFKVASKKHPELSMLESRQMNMVSGTNLDRMVEVYYRVNRE